MNDKPICNVYSKSIILLVSNVRNVLNQCNEKEKANKFINQISKMHFSDNMYNEVIRVATEYVIIETNLK